MSTGNERTMIIEVAAKTGEKVTLKAWAQKRRDHGKIIFLDARDRTGVVQCVVVPDFPEAYEFAKTVRNEDILEIVGLVKNRPVSAVSSGSSTGNCEIEVSELRPISKPAEELPVDISQEEMNLNLDTLLNYRPLTLRNVKIRSIFEIYAVLLESYAAHMRLRGFTEIKTPKLLSNATEGGANFFKVKYFDREAFLAQSPQFYKQSAVGIFERVFEIGSVFRAEPHFTTRHVNEYIGLDGEMGFIDGFEDVMNELESVMSAVMKKIGENCLPQMELYGARVPDDVPFVRMRLDEAVTVLESEYGKKVEDMDIDSEGERMIGDFVKKNHGSDFVFLTHYPYALRPFYSMPSEDGRFTETFDLLFRGMEIASGGQRIHELGTLKENMTKKGLNPDNFRSYLDTFRYGVPPHGGWGLGSERIVQLLLGLSSIKEAILYPRDVKRLTP